MTEARENDEIISLSDSQMMRWIDELNGIIDADSQAKKIKKEIKAIKKQDNTSHNRAKIKQLYNELDKVQFKKDYMCLIVDSIKDYRRACKGFIINGIRYVRLLGTNGGVKTKTIVFVNESIAPELRKRIENGRNPEIKMIPAKYEAYRALTCSGSIPVSMPNGILIVNDCITHFKETVIQLDDSETYEPILELRENAEIELNASDGFGLMSPTLAKKWSKELQLDYLVSGVNTRFAFEKGMVFTFDFCKFAQEIANRYIVKDAWGNDVDIRNVELILTTSMVKLWDSYSSCDDYLDCCNKNNYTFAVTKTCPKELEHERNLNYQFIQSYELSDDDIDELITPTVNEIQDIIKNDYAKTILFLKGMYLNDENVDYIENDFIKALMIEPKIFDDPFIKKKIYNLIKVRIQSAKIGIIAVHGNYSIVSGDPYALCQSIFDLEVTGLLNAGEIYNKYWIDNSGGTVVCFRAPMTCHNNIRKMSVVSNTEIDNWYQYMNTCTIINAKDSTCHALNGMDMDGDLIFLTDNKILLKNHRELPAIMCVQRKGEKVFIDEKSLIQSNINSFGDDIGKITNKITSMFDIQSQFDKNSKEYKELEYRIMCGQLYQQNAIDKAKGIIAKSMPIEWYNRASNKIEPDDSEKLIERKVFNNEIVADKKPYFMTYIYPTLSKEYKTYIKTSQKKCYREFAISIDELLDKKTSALTNDEKEFIKYYLPRVPVGTHNCVMNRICWKIEEQIDNLLKSIKYDDNYDYSVLKSDIPYTYYQMMKIKKISDQYMERLKEYKVSTLHNKFGHYINQKDNISINKSNIINDFQRKFDEICIDDELKCNILVDLRYKKNQDSKQLIWDICIQTIINNLLNKNNSTIHYPVACDSGDIMFKGNKFLLKEKKIIAA